MTEKSATVTNSEAKSTVTRKKKARGKVTIIRERCKGCSYCVAFCPQDVLELSSDFNAKGYHYPVMISGRDCTGCELCGMYCPDFAISGARIPVENESDESSRT